MLALLMNLGFAGGGTYVAPATTTGGSVTEAIDWKRLQRLRMQQGYLKDDEEALVLILAELTRRR